MIVGKFTHAFIFYDVAPIMAGYAGSFYFRIPFIFEMAEKAGAFSNAHMIALDDLRMTGCASELFALFKVSEVVAMVKDNFFEGYFATEQTFSMTS